MTPRIIAFALSLVLAGAAVASPNVGEIAPDWTLPGSDGRTHSLAELRGQHVVIAFFPKAYTKG